MKESANFFQVGGTLSEDAPSYIERSADDELLGALERHEICLVLAPRQTGKSSLMVHARGRLKEKGVRSGVVDLQRLGDQKNPDQFFTSIMNQIARTLDLETDATEWSQSYQSLSPTERFTNFIEDVVLVEVKGDVVLFFDEIDSILKLPFSDDFFTTIRSLFNARAINPKLERLTFVFLGTTTKSSFIKDRSRTPFNIGTDVVLGDFAKSKTESFKRVLGEDSDQLVDRIFYWTNGQPLLVQKLAAAAYSWPPNARTTERLDEEVERSYLQQKIEQDTHLKFIRDYLLSDSASVRKTLATYLDVLKGREVEENSQSPVHDRLKLAGVVKAEDHKLVPRNRIYASIFNEQWVQDKIPRNTPKLMAYAASIILTSALLWFFLLQPQVFPRFPDTTKLSKYTAEPSIEVELQVGDASRAFLDEKEIPISNGMARTTLGSLAIGKETHTIKLVAGLFSRTREIPLEVVFYPNWEIRQFPDARLNSINPMLEIEGRNINLIDVKDRQRKGTLARHNANVTIAIWSPDRARILAGSENGVVIIWGISRTEEFFGETLFEGNPVASFSARGGAILSMAFSPDGTLAAWGTEDGSISISKMEGDQSGAEAGRRFQLISTVKDEHGAVFGVAFASNGKKLVSGSKDGTLSLWSLENDQLRKISSSAGHSGAVLCVAFVPGQEQIASGGEDNTIKFWDGTTSLQLLSSLTGHSGPVRSISFSLDGRFLSGSDDSTVRVWKTTTLEVEKILRTFDEKLRTVAFPSASDSRIIYAQGVKNKLDVWDSLSYEEMQIDAGHKSVVDRIDFSPDGKRIASGSYDNTLKLWDVETGKELRTFTGHTETIFDVAFSPDGKRIISASADKTLKLWDVETGQELRTFTGHTETIFDVAFSPDGKRIISASADKTLKLWDVETGQELRTFAGHTDGVISVAFSPDGKRIISASWDQTLKLWDVETGQEPRTFTGHTERVIGVAFSPDGKRVISVSSDKTLKLWDVETGKELRTFTGHTGGVISVAFSPDGKRVISASGDQTLKLWDVETGQELRTFAGHAGGVNGAAFSPDGTMAVSGSEDGTLKLWWAAI